MTSPPTLAAIEKRLAERQENESALSDWIEALGHLRHEHTDEPLVTCYDLILHAPLDLAFLVGEVRKLQAELERCRGKSV